MFIQGEVDDSHFGVDEQGLTVIMGFGNISRLPQSFGTYSILRSASFCHLLKRLKWTRSNLNSMVEIGIILGMTSPSVTGASIPYLSVWTGVSSTFGISDYL